MNGYADNELPQRDRLSELQDPKERRIFELVDKLRDLDPRHKLELPYLVVCGSQSSGKSSVLEAISGLQFPRGEGMKTKFVTELRFRTGLTESFDVRLNLHPTTDPRTIPKFHFENPRLEDLELIIDRTEQILGLKGRRGFARDVLCLTITKPKQQPLTIIDAPGLIVSDEKGESLVELVEDIVHSLIEREECLILAVLEGDTEAHKQPVLKAVQKVDPSGKRTFGIITKPDIPEAGTQTESYWVEKARNTSNGPQDFNFAKGWHVLRNRGPKQTQEKTSLIERDKAEREFFADPSRLWYTVGAKYKGIDSLQSRLREIYLQHTKGRLPGIRLDITDRSKKSATALAEISLLLTEPEILWNDYNTECRRLGEWVWDRANGIYLLGTLTKISKAPEFGLRSRIEEAHDHFASELESNGHGLRLSNGENMTEDLESYRSYTQDMLKANRGQEIKGTTNALRLNQLFWEHSQPWFGIALSHVSRSHKNCEEFIEYLIMTVLQDTLPGVPLSVLRMMKDRTEQELEKHKTSAIREVQLLEKDRRQPIKTENHRFAKKLFQQIQTGRLYALMMRAEAAVEQDKTNQVDDGETPRLTPAQLARIWKLQTFEDSQAADAQIFGAVMLSYYEIAREVFIANVIHQVIERHLLRPLLVIPWEKIRLEKNEFIRIVTDERDETLLARKAFLEGEIRWLKSLQDELNLI